MEIRDILCVVDHTVPSENGFRYAANLARFHDANLFVLCPVPAIPSMLYVASQFNHEWLNILVDQLKSEEQRMFDDYTGIAMESGVDFEWWSEQGEPEDTIVRYSRLVDFVVVSVAGEEGHLAGTSSSPGGILLDSAAPMLMTPASAAELPPPRRVMIAWDGSTTAARSMKSALPLLRAADAVRVITIDGAEEKAEKDKDGRLNIVNYLERHGVSARADRVANSRNDEYKTLVEQVSENRCDLIVMGAYGHNRLKEIVLGGMTRKILQRLPVPVFMTR